MKKTLYLIFGFFVFGLFLVGCSDVKTQPNGTIINNSNISNLDRGYNIDLIVTSIEFNGVLYPLKNNKIPAPTGINIHLKETDYTEGELFTLVSKKPTIGILSNINVGQAVLKGEQYKVLAPYYREILGPGNKTMGQLVTLKNSEIVTPKDLEGRRVGIQGIADGSSIAAMTALRKVFMVDLNTIDFVVVDSNMAPILLEQGAIDATMLDSDYILTLEFESKYRTILDFNKELYYFYGTVPPASFFVVKQEFYSDTPEVYNIIIDYFTDNYNWYKNNAEEVSLKESQATGSDYELTLLKAQYEERAGTVTERDIAAYYDFYETAVLRGVIDTIPDLQSLFIQ